MQAFTSYSVHVSFITAIFSITCTILTQGQHRFSNIKQKSSNPKDEYSSHSELLRLKSFPQRLKNFDESSGYSNSKRHGIIFKDLDYLQDFPWQLPDVVEPYERMSQNEFFHKDIIPSEEDRINSANSDVYNRGLYQPHSSMLLNIVLSRRRKHLKKINVFHELEQIRKSLNKRLQFQNHKKQSLSSDPGSQISPLPRRHHSNALPSTTDNTSQFGRYAGLNRLISKHLSNHVAKSDDNAADTKDSSNFFKYLENLGSEAVNDNADNIQDGFHEERGDNNIDKSAKEYVVIDYSDNNGIHQADLVNIQDGGVSVASNGNENISRSDYEFHTAGKRGYNRDGRMMHYGRQRGGGVKARRPLTFGAPSKASRLRTHHKSGLRKYNDEIVRRQPLRQPLTFVGYTKLDINSPNTCNLNEDGSQPMRCPTSRNLCLYDHMICNGISDCPDGADESFPVCVTQHWAKKIIRKIESSTNTRNTA